MYVIPHTTEATFNEVFRIALRSMPDGGTIQLVDKKSNVVVVQELPPYIAERVIAGPLRYL